MLEKEAVVVLGKGNRATATMYKCSPKADEPCLGWDERKRTVLPRYVTAPAPRNVFGGAKGGTPGPLASLSSPHL